MAYRLLSGLLITLIFSISSWAEEIPLNLSHPDQYTVLKGDTLWNIAGKFLNHPWQWPELWRHNNQIENPNLIYPGDTIYFSVVNGKPQLSLARNEQPQLPAGSPCILKEEDIKNGRTDFAVSENGKLLPCIREITGKQAIKLVPAEAIAKYLTSPKVVGKNELDTAPYVIGFAGEHLIAGTGDKIYVRSITRPKSLSYTIYRAGDTYVSPVSGEILGYEAKYIADSTLQQAGDPATLAVTKSGSEIVIGDRIMVNSEEDVALNYFPRPPAHNIKGNIISVLGGVSQIGQYNVVVIDKGTADGLLPGHELDIYKRGNIVSDAYSAVKTDAVRLPDEIAGTLMVFRPFERISYALIMKAGQAIHVLDKVQIP
ncbi:Peptidoglycan-binding protein [Candidatus Methylobacter favarea]|uniref:Peptidoglycan-binding protein n=1 Tax=Candidatus Methylobacter favarea TaxID=2707345 RepID=A0A8S0YAQ7_9GAMM|nr:LysM domain-containing protein [Candidatus Methylobacter favarea]CAA9892377.1 Peptidoglycan-binding protein [Candidatus Methylobacter favarea]